MSSTTESIQITKTATRKSLRRQDGITYEENRIDEQKAKVWNASPMDEGRKRVLLIAAAILAARKLVQQSPGRVPATTCDSPIKS